MTGVQSDDIQRIQANWLCQWQRYMVSTYGFDCIDSVEVGCGSGHVMENLRDLVEVRGIDIDGDQVINARGSGFSVEVMDGCDMKFDDSSSDLVFCSFVLMWVEDPELLIDEMIRVARRKVIFLSEPVWSRTIFAPSGLKELVDLETETIREQGGDPDGGLELVRLLKKKGLNYRIGSVSMDTSLKEVRRWLEVERNYLSSMGKHVDAVDPEIFHVPFIWAVVDVS